MQLVEGVSMTQAVLGAAAGAPDWRVAFRVALHVSRALAYLHAQHILHRNVTPQNILVRSADATVKLGDLMKAKAQEGKRARQVTAAGAVLGELRFLSPEQTGGTAAVDGRSDLYSLGATAYALLTGRAPLEGKNDLETALLIRQAAPDPPRHLCGDVPPAFEKVVLKLLAKKPEDRYASVPELLAHLSELAGKPPFLDACRRRP
jgi:serine/threonine-protein kinase